jgi:hypothetical protein
MERKGAQRLSRPDMPLEMGLWRFVDVLAEARPLRFQGLLDALRTFKKEEETQERSITHPTYSMLLLPIMPLDLKQKEREPPTPNS